MNYNTHAPAPSETSTSTPHIMAKSSTVTPTISMVSTSNHLTTLKKYWEHLNLVDDNNFKIPEVQFKITIISSLLPSWDNFMRPYISIQKGDNADPKVHATSQELIRVLKEEYV